MRQDSERPTGGTVGGMDNGNFSRADCSSNDVLCQGAVEAVLRAMGAIGRDNAVTREQVARAMGLDSQDGKRTVSKVLEREREYGVICSSGSGLFLPADSDKGDQEVLAYISQVSRKGAGSFRSIRGARRYIMRRQRLKSDQMSFEECGDGKTADVFT